MTAQEALAFSALFTLVVTLVLTAIGWRVKDTQDSKIATLQSQLERELHMHKLTFEREFDILSNLWNALVDLRDSRPEDPVLLNTPEADREQQRSDQYRKFRERQLTLRGVFEKSRPFYPQEIYDLVLAFVGKHNVKAVFTLQYEELSRDFLSYSVIVNSTREDITTLNDQICDAIRKQLQPTTLPRSERST